ncbi:MAG: peptidyl-prolyl cis-trans isomerase [Sulfurimonadaceae bacterium]|jgi:hypothetical protein|nr:peptidyl-prolyl cis-trans isomerase [Sulfurimonadaceae bacterium]
MYKIFLLLVVAIFLEAKIINSTVAMVGTEPITSYDVKQSMNLTKLSFEDALEFKIREKLEEQEIVKRSIDISPSDVYDEIKHIAQNNNISVSALYDRVRETTGATSEEFKEQTRKKLLSQKLYSEIAYSSINEPSDNEIAEYMQLHKDLFSKPLYFDAIIYSSIDEHDLNMVQKNPMFTSPSLLREERELYYESLPQGLADLLESTPPKTFTQIVSLDDRLSIFFIKGVQKQDSQESQKYRVVNMIMADKREQVLSDYFSKLKNSSQVKILDKK